VVEEVQVYVDQIQFLVQSLQQVVEKVHLVAVQVEVDQEVQDQVAKEIHHQYHHLKEIQGVEAIILRVKAEAVVEDQLQQELVFHLLQAVDQVQVDRVVDYVHHLN
jgi:hypothetical protein